MVLTNDSVQYSVVYKVNNEMVTDTFNSFAGAAGCADALNNITRFINVKFYQIDSEGGESSISGSLYCYSKESNTRRVCNQYLVNQVTLRKGV